MAIKRKSNKSVGAILREEKCDSSAKLKEDMAKRKKKKKKNQY